MRNLAAVTIFVTLLTTSGWVSAGPRESIVQIWVELDGNARSFGTGFLISGDGRVLTAYHVVEGARSIKVFHRGQGYSNIVIEAIGPDVDLAVLRIEGFPAGVPYLKLVESPPPAAAREELSAFGHAAGILDQEFHTRMTRQPFVKSREFTTRSGRALFARDDVDLIALDMTIFSGLSGGPIVSSYGVLGVVSGSFVEGGSIAWAIPSKYAKPPYLRPVNCRPAELKWPILTLMGKSWQNLRSRVLIDESLAAVIDRYFDLVEALRAANDRVVPLAVSARDCIDLLVAAMDGGSANKSSDNPVVQRFKDLCEARVKEINANEMDQIAARSKLVSQFLDVHRQIDGLPLTSGNAERLKHMNDLILEIGRQLEEPRSYAISLRNEALQQVAHFSADTSQTRTMMLGFHEYLDKVTSAKAMKELHAEIAAYRRLGQVVEDLMNQPLDDWSSSWTFTSPNGFLLRFSGGWETGARLNEETRTKVSSQLEKGMIFDDMFVNWDGRVPGQDNPNIFLILSVQPPPVPDMFDDDIVTAFVDGIRRHATNVRWERRAIKGRNAFIVESIERGANWTRFLVFVPAGQRTIHFDFGILSNPAGNWPKCLAVLENLEVK